MVAGPLTVVQMLPELEAGGVERGVLETAAHLTKAGHRSLVISGGGRLAGQLEETGSEHLQWQVGAKSPALLRHLLPLRSLLAREKVDILHLRSRVPAWLGFLAAKSLPASRRPAVVTTFHGFYSVHFFSGIMARGDRVIAISHFISDHIQTHYKTDPAKITVIHRGFNPAHFNPGAVSPERVRTLKRQWGLSEGGGPVIMLVGRITGWKGHRFFLEALSRVRDQNFTAVCVGGLDENPAHVQVLREDVTRLGLEDRVLFAGHCDDVAAALLAADVAVSASIEPEAFGRVAVEAQAMGKPVVATAHGGSLETVRDGQTGWLVSPSDPADMARALSQAAADPDLRKKMGEQARQWAARFTTDAMCEKTLALYHELLAAKGRNP